MRLSGNYIDRLFISILPWTIIVSIILHFIRNSEIKSTLILIIISTACFWILDTAIIFFKFKNPRSLKFRYVLFWGDRALHPADILRITPVRDERNRWSFSLIEISMKDGTSFYIIDKPRHFVADILDKPSETLKRLLKACPELHDRITDPKII